MPVYGLPTPLESSLNTLLTQSPPNSWRVSSHNEDITVVIRWPRDGSSSCDKLVHCKSVDEESSEAEEQTSRHKRHMWSNHGKSLKRSKHGFESRERAEAAAIAISNSDSLQKKWESYQSPQPIPSSPYPVYLTSSGQGTQTISYAYATEKIGKSPKHAILAQNSEEVHLKSRRHLKDIGRSDSSPGRRSTASSTSSFSSSPTPSSDLPQTKSKHRRRIKSEPSSLQHSKQPSLEENEVVSQKNAESFYQSIARALTGYRQDHNGSLTDSPFRLGLSDQAVGGGPVANYRSNSEDKPRKCDVNFRSMQDSLTWDSIDCEVLEETQ